MKLRGSVRPLRGLGSYAAALLLSTSLLACNLDNPGVAPPRGTLAYPISVVTSAPVDPAFDRTEGEGSDEEVDALANAAGPAWLYVANSNFDVRYNSGSIQSYDLSAVFDAIVKANCRNVGVPEIRDAGVLPSADPDAGADGGVDGGTDAGVDAGAPGPEPEDAGASDGGSDGGASDAGTDAGPPDAAVPMVDAGTPDAGVADGGTGITDGYGNAAQYGTLRGILCDERESDPAVRACCFEQARAFVKDEIRIPSFATDLALRADGQRLYVPVRSKNQLLYLDVDGESISCGDDERCSQRANGDNPAVPDKSFPAQATSLVVGNLGQLGLTAENDGMGGNRFDSTFVATSHERGQVSLFVESSPGAAPLLQDTWDGGNGQLRSNSINLDPVQQVLYMSTWTSSAILRFGVRPQTPESPHEALLLGPSLVVRGVDDGEDVRDVEVDAEDPTLVYALVRGYLESLVYLRLDPTSTDGVRVIGATRVGSGPSKLTQASIGGRRVLLVSCYSARSIYIIDAASRELLEVVRGLSGPFEMSVDSQRQLLYVADFGSSVLRVVDVRSVNDRSKPPARIIATLGKPYFAGGL